MHCDVYKFLKHDEMYVYIARPDYPDDTKDLKDWLAVLPTTLRQQLGESQFLMHLDLDNTKKLARVDIKEVKQTLQQQGYFVQAPPADVLTRQAQNRVKAAQDKKYD